MTAKKGTIFLGRDEATYGKAGTGWVDYDPDHECGGAPGTAGRRCPFAPKPGDVISDAAAVVPQQVGDDPLALETMGLKGIEGRLLHVGIASYRDPLCPITLYNMFTKSKFPHRIRVRVIQQNDPEVDTDCLEGYCALMERDFEKEIAGQNGAAAGGDAAFTCPYEDAVFIHQIHAKEAKGPTFARALLSEDVNKAWQDGKVRQQDFCMSVDSHMDFEPHWDDSMVEMWDLAENEYALLSTYVADKEQLGVNLNGVHEVPHLCMVTFTSSVRTHATKCMRNMPRPKLTNAIYGAGLAFSKCHAELKVPVDPHTPFVFDGEEFNRAARLWTYGYDIYSPHRVYILHNYHESQSNPTTGSWHRQVDNGALSKSNFRMNSLLDVPVVSRTDSDMSEREKLLLRQSRFGLGDRRTLDQLIQFSGVDLRHRRPTIDGINRCGNLRWVPFEEHVEGVNYIPRFDDDEAPLDEYDAGSIWFIRAAADGVVGKVAGDDADRVALRGNVGSATGDAVKAPEDKLETKKNTNEAKKKKLKKKKKGSAADLAPSDVDGTSAEKAGRNAAAGFASPKVVSPEHQKPTIPRMNFQRRLPNLKQEHKRYNLVAPLGQGEHHGLEHLPFPIKMSISFLVMVLVFAMIAAARGRKVGRRRMGLKQRTV